MLLYNPIFKTMVHRITLSVLFFLSISLSVYAFQGTGYSLKAGDIIIADSESNQEISQLLMGQENVIKTITSTKEMIMVDSYIEGIYTIRLQTLAIRVEVDAAGMKQVADSEDPGSGGGFLAKLKNTSYSFTMDKNGTILDIIGLESLRDSLYSGQMANPQVATQVNQFLGDDVVRYNLLSRFSIYPTSETKSWDLASQFTLNGMPVNFKSTYTIESAESITSDGTMTIEGSSVQMGMPVDLNLSGTQNSTYSIDPSNGFLKSAETTSDISGMVEAQGLQIPMTIFNSAKSTFTKQ